MIGRTKPSSDHFFINNEQETNNTVVIPQLFNDYSDYYHKDIQEKQRGFSFDFSNLIPRNPNTMYLFNSTADKSFHSNKQSR